MKGSPGETIGVILLNLGGPDSLQAVRPFLYNLFSDRQIIRLGPSFLQKPLAALISTIRSIKTEKLYRLIGGKSPIKEITEAQARALEVALNKQPEVTAQDPASLNPSIERSGDKQGGAGFKVYIGMRYWHPLIEEAVSKIHNDKIKKLLALSLYPQYSVATSGSSFLKFEEAAAKYQIETACVQSWNDHPFYIDALVDLIKRGIEKFGKPVIPENIHVLFSAHSLPKKIIDEGDPYVDQTVGTIREITKRLPLVWDLSYQSRSGPVEWLGPSTENKLEELGREGVKNILVVPISFVSDHIETLYEIDILYKELAAGLGIRLERIDSLNTHPKFIAALKDIVARSFSKTDQGKIASLP